MPSDYQDVFPESPLSSSNELIKTTAAELLTLDFFEAEPGEMPSEVFAQHHILLNLKEEPHRVENWRDGEHRDFIYHKNEIIVTPAGVQSGWKWHAKSKVIVITLEPEKLNRFAQNELGVILSDAQLKNIPQFIDEDIVEAGVQLLEAMKSRVGSEVMFESFARIFMTKLILKYGIEQKEDYEFSKSFTAKQYKKVLHFIAEKFADNIVLEDLAQQAGLSTYHFARLFKQTIGKSPHQFVMTYRVEQAKKMLTQLDHAMIDIALDCGFSDQAHFSRTFKQIAGQTPKQWRQANAFN